MTLFEKIISFTRNSFETQLYFLVMAFKENFRNYIARAGRTEGAVGERMAILGNGPSLREEMPRLKAAMGEKEFMAVNFFAGDPDFEVLRPRYYVLSDPMFFRDTHMKERVAEFYRTLNDKVSWPMTLYVQYYNPEGFDYRRHLPNPLIRIVPFHTYRYDGFERVLFWLFDHGLGSANYGTVVQNGEYVALLLGYREIELYGVDHTLLEGLAVDDGNRLCRADRHYYDDGSEPELKPMYQKVPHRPYTMAVYMDELAQLFRGHEILRRYADARGARIFNCTRCSMIDAYERRR